MEDLIKIATSEEVTYLEKVAAIVDEFAAGNISGDNADALAVEVGISPDDLLGIYNATYGEDGMEKTAGDEALADLTKIAEDAHSTYLEKCAGVADAYMNDAITQEEAVQISENLGLHGEDVDSVINLAYGDVLNKEAKYGSEMAGKAAEKVKAFATEDYKAYKAGKIKASGWDRKNAGPSGQEQIKAGDKEAIDALISGSKKALGVTAGVGATGYAASKMLGKKEDK